jgi:hypothetical protein
MERARNVPFGDETRSINIYADRTSTVAIASFYPDCGMPKGFVAVKDKHPDTCTTTVTTGTAPP